MLHCGRASEGLLTQGIFFLGRWFPDAAAIAAGLDKLETKSLGGLTMFLQSPSRSQSEIVYPDSDGQPMADNTKQFRWIVVIQQNLDWWFAKDANVFVAGDLCSGIRLRENRPFAVRQM
jgi:hypothetical protein